MIIPVKKLEIIVYSSYFEPLLELLQHLGYVQIDPVPLTEEYQRDTYHRLQHTDDERTGIRTLEEIGAIISEIRDVTGNFHSDPGEDSLRRAKESTPDEILSFVKGFQRRMRSLVRRKRNIQEDYDLLSRFEDIHAAVEKLENKNLTDNVFMFLLQSEDNADYSRLAKSVRKAAPDIYINFFRISGNKKLGLVLSEQDIPGEIKSLIWNENTIEFSLPLQYRSEDPGVFLRKIASDLSSYSQEISSIGKELDELCAGHIAFLSAVDITVREALQRLEVYNSCIATDHTRLLHAWVPHDLREDVITSIEEVTEGNVCIHTIDDTVSREDVPVTLRNNRYSRPFEILLDLFSPPQYNTYDPTLINSITIPLFFGLIVGDIGYGLIIMLLAAIVGRRFRGNSIIRDGVQIAGYCAVSTTIFGILYGEAFGNIGRLYLGLWEPVLDREESSSILVLFGISVAIGVIHLSIGLILGMVNAIKLKDSHILLEKLGLLICLFSVLALAAFAVLLPGAGMYVSGGVFLLGIVVIYMGEGIRGVLEITSLFTNVFSYSRLMALGVAGVTVAKVANEMFFKFSSGAAVGLIAGIITLVLLHGINIIISMFSPFIHSLRLNYVEFFNKFYQTGGKKFKSFGVTKRT